MGRDDNNFEIQIKPGIPKEFRKRVMYKESIGDSIKRIPFLQRFIKAQCITEHHDLIIKFNVPAMNEYIGADVFSTKTSLTSNTINCLLAEAERRGDI